MSREGASRSNISSVFNSCSKACEVGPSLQLDYFLCSYRVNYHDGTSAIGTIRNYINLDVDTIWLTKTTEAHLLPEDIQWVCGKCGWFYDANKENLFEKEAP
jgi:hypothetical protein